MQQFFRKPRMNACARLGGGDDEIGIIGSGKIGGTLARHFVAVGHEVAVSNSRGPETLAELVSEFGPAPRR